MHSKESQNHPRDRWNLAGEEQHLSRIPVLTLLLFIQFFLMTMVITSANAEARPQDATQGSLWLRGEQAHAYQAVPTLDTAVDMDITGMLARVHVRQTFHNPGQSWAEGIYVFPLPEQSAVDHLRMHIGERVIEGQIQEGAEAKKTYKKAKQAGQRTSLVEQERPNIFTTSLANIAPGESITVEIEYQQTVRYVDGAFRLRFPMVVGPRYIPGHLSGGEEEMGAFSGSGWARGTNQVPDAAHITPPVQPPRHGAINPLAMDIHLNAGMSLSQISSPYHAIDQQQIDKYGYRIQLARIQLTPIQLTKGSAPADRDFELIWRPQTESVPNAAWFIQQKDNERYGLLMLVPPQHQAKNRSITGDVARDVPRDVVFVIDTSGSMHGDSINQARKALLVALNRLTDQDRFNVIRFNQATKNLFSQPRAATENNLVIARHFVNSMDANGGTEMLPALETALRNEQETLGVRQVIFLTDGSVGNEGELFQVIRQQLGHSRLFTIGIGSAPNSYFMRKAAEYGRGTFTYIGKTSEVMEKMSTLFTKLEQPAITDIRLELPADVKLDRLPQRIPDLYLGEPLLIAFHGDDMPQWVKLHGRVAGKPWKTKVTLDGGQQGAALAPEWGRRKIAELMTRLHDADNGQARQSLRNELVSTALAHHLVSKYTSLVAVDVMPVRNRSELIKQHGLTTNLPKGWSYEQVFGLPQTATPAQLHLLVGLLLLLLASLEGYWIWRRSC